jgi:hypothetical protein
MARPHVSDGETASMYIWRVAANILNKPEGGGTSQGLGLGLILWCVVSGGNET